MDSYEIAVNDFYTLYFQYAEGYGWEHRVSLRGYEQENVIEVRNDSGTVIRVKDEDPENVWNRAAADLQSWLNRHKR